jgi:hypothetical protein
MSVIGDILSKTKCFRACVVAEKISCEVMENGDARTVAAFAQRAEFDEVGSRALARKKFAAS